MTKVIKLDSMIDGFTTEYMGESLVRRRCKTIQDQMAEILEGNQNYTFVELVYHPSKTINMEYASLIVDVK